MTTVEPTPLTDAAVTQRARLRTLAQRRRRLWRRITFLIVVTIAMVLAVMLNRDTQHLRGERKLGEMVATELQSEFERRRDPPLMFPSGRDAKEDRLTRELSELNQNIGERENQKPKPVQTLAELKHKRDEVKRQLEPLVAKRKRFEQQQERHDFNLFYVDRQKSRPEGDVGVCWLKNPVRFFVRTEGRIVILFDGKNFKSRWMPESEFRAAAGQLGFGDLARE
jgi:hypothetical protein